MSEHQWLVMAKCARGHKQTIRVGGMSKQIVELWAGLMDGTSDFYVYPPIGSDSVIGKCGICKAQIRCEVKPVEE